MSAALTSPLSDTDRQWATYRPLSWLIPLALLHGLLYLVIVPPWQHYDEPSHFEYAWLIANHNHIPTRTESDQAVRRMVADSMYRFRFYAPEQRPDLISPVAPILGSDQRAHPPLYYALAALPLRLTSGLAVEQQLYMARTISLGLYVLTIVVAWRVATVVVPDEPLMQLVVPLLLLLTPTFTDIMTAVNNDVLVNFAAVVLLLGCVLLICNGPHPTALVLTALALGVGLGTKRTAVILLVPTVIALIWAWHRTPLRPWISIGGPLVSIVGLTLAGLEISQLNGVQQLALRPWLVRIDDSYLRLNLDSWVRSVSSANHTSDLYWNVLIIGFTSFWARLGWGHVQLGIWIDWALALICIASMIGLFIQGWNIRSLLPIWQRRSIGLFQILVVLGLISIVARLYPLPAPGSAIYIPRGRYIFTVMLPVIWLLTLGWQGLLPNRWKPIGPFMLIGIWVALDLLAWAGTLVSYYYRPML